MSNLNFTCPKCGSHEIDEIKHRVCVTSRIDNIIADHGTTLEFDYSDEQYSGGIREIYECANCKYVIAHSKEQLVEVLEANNWIEDSSYSVEGDGNEYINSYECECGERWEDVWHCNCKDHCPKCDKEIMPYESHLVEKDDVNGQ